MVLNGEKVWYYLFITTRTSSQYLELKFVTSQFQIPIKQESIKS